MSKLIIHAGMNKTGSTSIQNWLSINAETLENQDNLNVLKAERGNDEGNGCKLLQVKSNQNSASNEYIKSYRVQNEVGRLALINEFIDRIYQYLERGRDVIVSSEAFYGVLIDPDNIFIRALEHMAFSHDILIAYYVRPQNTALEAGWCQWGFRGKNTPKNFLTGYKNILYYYKSYRKLKEAAPSINIYVGPYRRDLLASGNAVPDFVENVLRLRCEKFKEEDQWLNSSLPLSIVNILRKMPDNLLWTSAHDNRRIERLKKIIRVSEIKEDDRIRMSREMLKDYCYREFEESNHKLIEEMGWNTASFIAPPENDDATGKAELAEIDDLWNAKASPAELIFVSQLIDYIVNGEK